MLKDEGYRLEYRGIVQVKGKGHMETYFVLGKKMDRTASMNKSQQPAAKNSMTDVISGLVEVRRKQALSSSLSVPSSSNKSIRKSPPPANVTINMDDELDTLSPMHTLNQNEYNFKKNHKFSASFRFRKSPEPTHRLNRMMSEISHGGRNGARSGSSNRKKLSKLNACPPNCTSSLASNSTSRADVE